MGQGFYGFPRILDIVRATTFKAIGKVGATNGAALAGGTASGAPTSGGPFDVGDVIVDATGTLWICTVAGTSQSSPGSFTQVGTLVDPMSARGDLIVRGASSTTRLALGSNNQVLTSNGTDALWAVSPASAGGALTQIAQTVLGSTTASITFSSIAGSYSSLQLVVQGRGDASATNAFLDMQLNTDTAANYDRQFVQGFASTATAQESLGQTAAAIGYVTAATAASGRAAETVLWIPNYAATTFDKGWNSTVSLHLGTSSGQEVASAFSGVWRSTAAITSIKIFPHSGSFIAGTTATLYGLA